MKFFYVIALTFLLSVVVAAPADKNFTESVLPIATVSFPSRETPEIIATHANYTTQATTLPQTVVLPTPFGVVGVGSSADLVNQFNFTVGKKLVFGTPQTTSVRVPGCWRG
jgi:hypothetical protein